MSIRSLIAILFTIICFESKSQTLFFDKVDNSIWFSDKDSIAQNVQLRFVPSGDSIKHDAIIWQFLNNELRIVKYEAVSKRRVAFLFFRYEVVMNRFLKVSDKFKAVKYNVGITSDGLFAVLTKKRGF